MSDFTPGPWRICVIGGMVAIDGANGEQVTGFVSPEDGRLIAAAPDLLEALQHVALTISADDYLLDYFQTGYAKARAAIAKATGEQP